jgi:hypothetical protein
MLEKPLPDLAGDFCYNKYMIINVKVKPGAKIGPKVELVDGVYVVFLHERAKEGEANAGLIKVLADYFDVPKTSIKIKSGMASRNKIVEIG